MLRELKVRNFAIVDDRDLVFAKGLTGFTGETGAGKSLLLDAITLLLGAKANSDLVRTGADSAEVEGVFDLQKEPQRRSHADELGFAVSEDDGFLLVVRREISANASKNRIWIQGRSATRSQLQELLGSWVEVSGQHEFLRLSKDAYLLEVVDQFGGLGPELREFESRYTKYRAIQKEYDSIREAEESRGTRIDFLRFQIEEFEKAGIHTDLAQEEERLVALRNRLGSVEKLRGALEVSRSVLDGAEGDSQEGVVPLLQKMGRELRPFAALDAEFSRLSDSSEQLITAAVDALRSVDRLMGALEADPQALESAESTLSKLTRLKRKYNVETKGLIELLTHAKGELSSLEQSGDRLQKIQLELEHVKAEIWTRAQALHKRRAAAALELATLWQKDVRLLGMKDARLEVECVAQDELSSKGMSRVEARLSANAGSDPKPIAKVASGGELSRILLSLKNLVSGRSEIGVFLFDEVDAGIGGETAKLVAQRLKDLSKSNQVLVVTHLAQIAAKADHHFRIAKQTVKGRTRTQISPLAKTEREEEIARMLGATTSTAARSLARELLGR
jgi:DNA repair protein RecN (Recombination protein N)